jgi:hypothetical protein
MSDFALHLPINSVSFGQVSIALLREFFKKGYKPCIFPIGQPDASAQKVEQEFANWLNECLNKSITSHSRKVPVFKLWHLDGSLESFSERQVLFSFYELDSPTSAEINIVRNNTKVIFSNTGTVNTFQAFGATNVAAVPLGFDKANFFVKDKKYYHDDRIIFNLLGKFEKRKHHAKVIKAWARKFGNNPKYFLNAAIYNPFFKPEDNANIFNSLLEGRKFFNVNFVSYMAQNDLYNDFINQGNIVIAMSGAEGWGLGEFHSVAMGKYCVGLYAHAHRDWMTPENSVLVNPCGKIEAYDGFFFQKGRPFNQGNIFDFNDDEFIAGCEEAIKRYQANKINAAGLELQNKFSYEKTVDAIIEHLKDV